MAGDKALFNDMLGSTLGVAANGSYTPINRTSFGEVDNASSSEYNFFTGKPNVEGLGYSFLFRNYNANNGKWLSQDPLGYPDGWNNTAYGNNHFTSSIDWLGGLEIGEKRWVDSTKIDTVKTDPVKQNDGTIIDSFPVGPVYPRNGHYYQMYDEYEMDRYVWKEQRFKMQEEVQWNGTTWVATGKTKRTDAIDNDPVEKSEFRKGKYIRSFEKLIE